jgi:hypothetical protein
MPYQSPMQYRITYRDITSKNTETIIVGGIRAVYALIDYANRWHDEIILIEERERRTRAWKTTTITQGN